MVFHSGSGENGLAVIVDSRTKTCAQIEETLSLWSYGNRFLGKAQWNRTLRIALREHGTEPLNTKQARALLPEVRALLKERRIRAVIIMQSPSVRGQKTVHSAWNALGRPGNPYKWAGTALYEDAVYKCPILHPQNYEYAYHWLIHRWFQQALALAQGRIKPLQWPKLVYQTGQEMLDVLEAIKAATGPLSVDIETNTGGSMFTAIGLSRGNHVICAPWEGFQIAGKEEWEPSLEAREYGPEIKAAILALLASDIPKVGHNFAYDVFQLRRRGIAVGGEIHDTLLLARTAFPQFRRSLQQAAVMEFCVEPWKSLHKPPGQKKKVERYDKWLATPVETRIYCCKDTYMTGLLMPAFSKRIEYTYA